MQHLMSEMNTLQSDMQAIEKRNPELLKLLKETKKPKVETDDEEEEEIKPKKTIKKPKVETDDEEEEVKPKKSIKKPKVETDDEEEVKPKKKPTGSNKGSKKPKDKNDIKNKTVPELKEIVAQLSNDKLIKLYKNINKFKKQELIDAIEFVKSKKDSKDEPLADDEDEEEEVKPKVAAAKKPAKKSKKAETDDEEEEVKPKKSSSNKSDSTKSSKKSDSKKSDGPSLESLRKKAETLNIKGHNTMKKSELEYCINNPQIVFNKKRLTQFMEYMDEVDDAQLLLINDDDGLKLKIGEHDYYADKCKAETIDEYDESIRNRMFKEDKKVKLNADRVKEVLKECKTNFYIFRIDGKLKIKSSLCDEE